MNINIRAINYISRKPIMTAKQAIKLSNSSFRKPLGLSPKFKIHADLFDKYFNWCSLPKNADIKVVGQINEFLTIFASEPAKVRIESINKGAIVDGKARLVANNVEKAINTFGKSMAKVKNLKGSSLASDDSCLMITKQNGNMQIKGHAIGYARKLKGDVRTYDKGNSIVRSLDGDAIAAGNSKILLIGEHIGGSKQIFNGKVVKKRIDEFDVTNVLKEAW